MQWSTLGYLATRGERKYGEQIAIVSEGRRFTYLEFNRRCCQLANALTDLGLKKGDNIAFMCYNTNEALEILIGAGKVGVVVLPTNRRLSVLEITKIFQQTEPKALFFDQDFMDMAVDIMQSIPSIMKGICIGDSEESGFASYEKLIGKYPHTEPDIKIEDEDIHSIYFTSGTTGTPKGVMRTHSSNVAMAIETALTLKMNSMDPYVLLYSFPITSAAFYGLGFTAFLFGGRIVLQKVFNAQEFMSVVVAEKVTMMAIGPTMWDMLLEVESDFTKYDLSHVRWAAWGGMPVSEWTTQEMLRRGFPIPLTCTYGLSECTCCIYQTDFEVAKKKPKSAGKPTPSTEFRIVDPNMNDVKQGEMGELIIRSPIIMKGYYGKPDITKETIIDGWLKTGDTAMIDEDGDLFIVDRIKDMIISGGENIYPAEVENVIANMPEVREVAVIGVPDKKWGQSVTAYIVLEEGKSLTEQEVKDYCVQYLARYKRPKFVKFVDEIHKNDMGKFQKNWLLQSWLNEDLS